MLLEPATTPSSTGPWWVGYLGAGIASLLAGLGFSWKKPSDPASEDDKKLQDRMAALEARQETQGNTLVVHTQLLAGLDELKKDSRSSRECLIRIAQKLDVKGPE